MPAGLTGRLRMPSLDGATGWLSSQPLGRTDLHGHVVLVNFWTLTCINWLRQEPTCVVAGLPRRRSGRHRCPHAGVLLRARQAFTNHCWPALYFVDAEGVIRDQHLGEGRYEQSEQVSLVRPRGSIAYRFHARDAHVVLSRGSREPVRFHVLVDGAPPGQSHGVDVDEDGHGVLEGGRLYNLVRERDAVRERTLEIAFLDAGAEAYAFTFG